MAPWTFHTLKGEPVSRLGQGTWRMGERSRTRQAEADVLREGLDLGLNLVDTAEMYAEAERVVGQALRGRRDEAFVVSKVLPQNASRRGTVEAAERTLRALATDVLDLYLLHWSGPHPLTETLEAFDALRAEGKIRYFGVSNFDAAELRDTLDLPHGAGVVSNQILYNLARREAEADLLPLAAAREVQIMAYSPFEQGRLPQRGAIERVAARHEVTWAAVALAWVLRHEHVVTIPKTARREHLAENARAIDLGLDPADLAALDAAFPPPKGPRPLPSL